MDTGGLHTLPLTHCKSYMLKSCHICADGSWHFDSENVFFCELFCVMWQVSWREKGTDKETKNAAPAFLAVLV
jgi:hypothetical protein